MALAARNIGIGHAFRPDVAIALVAVTVAVCFATFPGAVSFLIAVGLLAAAAVRGDALIYGMIALLPLNPLLQFDLPIHDVFTLLRLSLFFIMLGAALWQGASLWEWVAGARLKQLALLFLLVATLSLYGFHTATIPAQRAMFRLVSYVGFFFALTAWVRTPHRLASITKTILVSTIGVAAFGFYQALEGGYTDLYFRIYPSQEEGLEPWVGRITSFLFHFNSLAGYLNLILPFAIGCSFLARGARTRLLARVCWVCTVSAILLTQSRGGLLAAAAIHGILAVLLPNTRKQRLRAIVALVLVAAVLVPVLSHYAERLTEIDEQTSTSRMALWGAAVAMFLSSPIIGVGYGNYRGLYATYLGGAGGLVDAHNTYLQSLAETGIVGFIVFFSMIAVAVITAYRQVRGGDTALDRIIGFGVIAAMIGFLIHGAVDYLFVVSPQFGALFWMVLALLMANDHLRRTGQADPNAI